MAIEVVFFDAGGTLLFPCPSVAQTFASVANERGHALSLAQVERHIPAMDAYYEREYARDGDFWCTREGSVEIWLEQYRLLCRLTGIADDAEGMARAVHRAFCRGDHWACFDDVAGCLQALKGRGMRLGVVSNWDDGLGALLDDLGLLAYFDDVVSSAAVGLRKPDPAVFRLACDRMGACAESCVHVGDNPEADGAGARAAGVAPIIVDRSCGAPGCDFPRVASLGDVAPLLAAQMASEGL